MQEIIAGAITALDVIAIFLLIPTVKYRFFLSVWTAFLHMLFPLIGFYIGEWSSQYLVGGANLLSNFLLCMVGLHLLLSAKQQKVPAVSSIILAIMASLDTFSVSVSFGMLHLQKYVFIASTGLFTFVLSYTALSIKKHKRLLSGEKIHALAGFILIAMGLWSLIR